MDKVRNTEQFIEKATKLHNGKYNYSKVEYKNAKIKVCILCPIHGEFWQTPNDHLNGCGCSVCGIKKVKMTLSEEKEDFIEKVKQIHRNKYDYSKVEYSNNKTRICVICPKHGEFWQTPKAHLRGQGCPYCSKTKKLTLNEFIAKANIVHNNTYDYSKAKYVNNKTLVCIICPKHGEFLQIPNAHLRGQGCPKCNGGILLNTKEFIEKAKSIHSNKYDYSKVEYKNCETAVTIICPQHGEFFQKPVYHLQGQGCPRCNQSHLEREVIQKLEKSNIDYHNGKKFDWLGQQHLDFYLPKYNVAIECQGRQHFTMDDFFGGEEGYQVRLARDKKKLKLCQENGVKLLYYTTEEFDEFLGEKVYRDLEELLVEVI